MSLVSPTKIFQYIPKLIPQNRKKRSAGSWFTRERDEVERKTQNNTDDSPSKSVPDVIEIDRTEKSPETRGQEQHTKDLTLKKENDKNKLDELIRKSNRSILSISSTFPWNFFPNTIDVEESRVTFIFRQLFASQSHSVDIKDISNVFIESGFFFATLQVVSRTFIQNDIKIEFLKKKEALRMKGIIEGLRTFAYHDIDTSNYEITELVTKLKGLNITKTMQ